MIIIIIVLQLNNNNNSNNNNNIIIISNRNTPFKNLNAPTSEKETAKKKKENNWLKQLNYEGIIAQCGDGDEKGKF